ncbi:hypothetical protein B9J07_28150 [Sinorhizobium sp. LM21]|uniref:hypothetical protein n=1 Tax=Sinorhizobium sp. LM21 TaxID=1449788 RepID=UPI0005D89140|nr:hypothetical protein [Sinorhizobium sp. LM21]AJW30136.1 hypothetical protein pLM21S1_p15 [Sinorhizobium sp. LM21]OWZ90460.1 hypothetical protein B9J07_28150 [Sinorhizobium sp. LM21]
MSLFISAMQKKAAVLTLEIAGLGFRSEIAFESEAALKEELTKVAPKLVDQLNEAVAGRKADQLAAIDAKIAALNEQRASLS